ncbi:MAG: zf-HC2 domain-containing protein [Armatimonadota bacterium]
MKKCCYVKQLNMYLDKEFSESEIKELETHISSCEECKKELAELISLNLLLASVKNVESDKNFADVQRKIADTNTSNKTMNQLFGLPRWSVAAIAVASILFGFVLGTTNLKETLQDNPSQELVADAMELWTFDDMVAASFVYGQKNTHNGSDNGGSL